MSASSNLSILRVPARDLHEPLESGFVGFGAAPRAVERIGRMSQLAYPFTLGVASGDPLPGSVVLWTRLAPAGQTGAGTARASALPVRWEVCSDDGMTRIVRAGTATACAAHAYSVHVEVRGLVPGGVYWYRFFCGGHESPIGCTRVAPAMPGPQAGVRFALVSGHPDQAGFFQTYDAIARDDLDFVLCLGDHAPHSAPKRSGDEQQDGYACALAAHRRRQALYKSDARLQVALRALPFLFAPSLREDRCPCSLAARQAFWEHTPLRSPRPHESQRAARAQRRFSIGGLVDIHIWDPVHSDAAFVAGLESSRAPWRIVVREESGIAERRRSSAETRLLDYLRRRDAQNCIVVSAGRALAFVAPRLRDLTASCTTDDARVVFHDESPGYLRIDLTKQTLRTELLALPQLPERNGALSARTSRVFENGR